MPKLIRDLIPDDMRSHGFEPELTRVRGSKRREWLLAKLVEETFEATADNGSIAELADVYECIRSIAEDAGRSIQDVIAYAEDKALRRGRFEQGYLWLDSDSKDGLNRRQAEDEYARAESARLHGKTQNNITHFSKEPEEVDWNG